MGKVTSWSVMIVVAASCGGKSEDAAAPVGPTAAAGSDASNGTPDGGVVRSADRLRVATDLRVELFSVLFGFAGAKHYGRGTQASYMDAMGKHFKPYARHPAVLATVELQQKHGIGYEAPMKLAVYLDENLQPTRPLDPTLPGLERWKDVDIDAYLDKVRAFAAETHFAEFFAAQEPVRRAVEDRFRTFLADKDILPWFDSVFGTRPGASYRIIPALVVGRMNYGVSALRSDGGEDIVLVMFLENPTGKAFEPGEPTLGLLIHELAHSYVNRVFDARYREIEAVFAPLFARVEPAMRSQSYSTPPIALNETVVRAVTVMYLREKSTPAHAERALAEENSLSFVWAGPLADALAARRQADGGRLSAEALFETTRATLAAQPR